MKKIFISLLVLFCIGCLLIGVVSSNTSASITVKGIVKNNSSECGLTGKLKPKSPIALFDTKPKIGYHPLIVTFKDKSIHTPTSWHWSFGDGTYSNNKNPKPHIYRKIGIYYITLKISNCAGTDTKHQFIVVLPKLFGIKQRTIDYN